MRQITETILMIRPVNFRANEQTAVNNYYQNVVKNTTEDELIRRAQQEFDDFVTKLRSVGVEVVVIEDTVETDTPDAHFPNNWVSFHDSGTVIKYPMYAANRRTERRDDVFDTLEEQGFVIDQVMDYSSAEAEEVYLEGTGSIVLDRENRKAYCALSARSHESLFIEFCEDFEYTPVIFTANQTINEERLPIYHTNVMMCVGTHFAVICLDSIDEKKERKNVLQHLKADGKEIIAITETQLISFAGNMLQVCNQEDTPYLVMSTTAYKSLDARQLTQIEKHAAIIHSPLDVIEYCGGGSARCMMAEVFLPKKKA